MVVYWLKYNGFIKKHTKIYRAEKQKRCNKLHPFTEYKVLKHLFKYLLLRHKQQQQLLLNLHSLLGEDE